jgi:hypothetical protein
MPTSKGNPAQGCNTGCPGGLCGSGHFGSAVVPGQALCGRRLACDVHSVNVCGVAGVCGARSGEDQVSPAGAGDQEVLQRGWGVVGGGTVLEERAGEGS